MYSALGILETGNCKKQFRKKNMLRKNRADHCVGVSSENTGMRRTPYDKNE